MRTASLDEDARQARWQRRPMRSCSRCGPAWAITAARAICVRRRGALQIAVTPFTKIATGRQEELAAEAADIGRFLDLPATLTVTPPES